jgi:Notch-like protein
MCNICRVIVGYCYDKPGYYACDCPATWRGTNCNVYDPTFPGGLVEPDSRPGKARTKAHDDAVDDIVEQKYCVENDCASKARNGQCNPECNYKACNFDGTDCSLGTSPYANCSAGHRCWDLAFNGECDLECYNVECHFDGFDCAKELEPCK